ncbi:hypothetical protein [Streptomyces sp. NPDC048445]|uniref:hypothetical protein n=1 Tax=Streptomyces sp. NPDC048445 TaxID=3365553 RepID=UPI003723F637
MRQLSRYFDIGDSCSLRGRRPRTAALTGIAPGLAMAAAIGLLVLQVLATALHLSRSEVKETGLNVALIVLAAVAARLATTW